jgi:hypothetical protein
MMHQPIDQPVPVVEFNDRPDHPRVISNDEILDLVIDLETIDAELMYDKYFAV